MKMILGRYGLLCSCALFLLSCGGGNAPAPPPSNNQTPTVQLLKNGEYGRLIGVANITVVLQDPDSGAVLDKQKTDVDGFAHFNVGQLTRMTLTILPSETPNAQGALNVATLFRVPVSDLTLRFDQLELVGLDETPAATVDVEVTQLYPYYTYFPLVDLSAPSHDDGDWTDNAGVVNFSAFPIWQSDIAGDGSLSLLAENTEDGSGLLSCGSAKDIPASSSMAKVAILADQKISELAFFSVGSIPASFYGARVRHKNVDYDLRAPYKQYGSPTTTPPTPDIVTTCMDQFSDKNQDRNALTATTPHTSTMSPLDPANGWYRFANSTHTHYMQTDSVVPTAWNVTMPELSIDSITVNFVDHPAFGEVTSFDYAVSGAAANSVNVIVTKVAWSDSTHSLAWAIYGAPTDTHFAHIPFSAVKAAFNVLGPLGYDGSKVTVEAMAIDGVANFDDYWSKVTSSQGDMRGVAMTAQHVTTAHRTLAATWQRYEVQTDTGIYNGKVLGDGGLNCGNGAVTCSTGTKIKGGQYFHLHALANPDGEFVSWGGDCAAFTTPTVAFVVDNNKNCPAYFKTKSSSGPRASLEVGFINPGWRVLVTTADGNINCGWDGQGFPQSQCWTEYPSGTPVQLNAAVYQNSPPLKLTWSANCTDLSGNGGSVLLTQDTHCQLTIDQAFP